MRRATERTARGPLLAIVAEGFFSRLSFGLISFALPLYAYHLGLSIAEIGLLVSLNLIVGIALKPLMGWVADRVGLKPTLTVAIVLRSIVSLLLVFATSPFQLFAIRALHGVSIALRDPSVNVLIADLGGKRAVASSFAWYQTAKSVAGGAGRAAAGILLAVLGGSFAAVFAVAFALSVLPLFVVVRAVREPAAHTSAEEVASVGEDGLIAGAGVVRARRWRGSAMSYAVLGMLVSGTAYMMANLFPVLATEYAGLSTGQTGVIYVISVGMTLTGPAWGSVSDRVSRELALSIRGVANTVSSVLYLVAPNFLGLAVGRATDDLGKAAFRPAWGALMAQVASLNRRRRARTMSYLTVGEDLGEIGGPIVAGLLWSAWGVPVVLAVRIILAVASEGYAHALTRSSPGPETSPVPSKEDGERAAASAGRLT
jgi:MFS family permease